MLALLRHRASKVRVKTRALRWLFVLSILQAVLFCHTMAKETLLVETRNDINERDDRLYLELDDEGRPVELVHRVYDIVMGVYQAEELHKGIVLRRHGGRDVLKLKVSGFDPIIGGRAKLTYLSKALPFIEYKSMNFNIRKHEGAWRLFQYGDGRPVKLLFFRAHFSSIAGIQAPTGVKQIRVIRESRERTPVP